MKEYIYGGIIGIVLAAFGFVPYLVFVEILDAQNGPPNISQQNSVVSWDATTTNADGTPMTDLAGYVLVVTDETVDLNNPSNPLLPPIARVRIDDPLAVESPGDILFTGLTGQNYRVWVSAFDTSENQGSWGVPFLINLDDGKIPGAVVNVKVTVQVIVEVTNP